MNFLSELVQNYLILAHPAADLPWVEQMKSESLVIADQHAAVNTFPGLVHTARHTTRVCNTRSR